MSGKSKYDAVWQCLDIISLKKETIQRSRANHMLLGSSAVMDQKEYSHVEKEYCP